MNNKKVKELENKLLESEKTINKKNVKIGQLKSQIKRLTALLPGNSLSHDLMRIFRLYISQSDNRYRQLRLSQVSDEEFEKLLDSLLEE